jgi:hypothetical protein
VRLFTAASVIGALGSLGFLLLAGQRPPLLLLVIMAIWVVAPFVALLLAERISKSWPGLVRTTLSVLLFLVTLGSLTAYAGDALRPRKAQAAFVFVAAPMVSWALIAIAVPIAALVSRRRSRRLAGKRIS